MKSKPLFYLLKREKEAKKSKYCNGTVYNIRDKNEGISVCLFIQPQWPPQMRIGQNKRRSPHPTRAAAIQILLLIRVALTGCDSRLITSKGQ